ncbi:MAG: ribonuclease HII [Rhabdochlamydiaceae bacterium]|nr:ribonuclease HII [Rhabdochlamydiaceae bacterium]
MAISSSQDEMERLKKLCLIEAQVRSQGFRAIAGVDEAGRGPLAGPVVAAACILPDGLFLEGIDDSKKLSAKERFVLFEKIKCHPAVHYSIGIVDALIIDQVNILQATFQAMLLAISALQLKPDFLLVDGNKLPSTELPAQAIVKGDSRCQSIAAASILAKETRDSLMLTYHEKWPEYNFSKHKGYGTKEHLLAIEKYGPCPIHRMSFEPLKSQFFTSLN